MNQLPLKFQVNWMHGWGPRTVALYVAAVYKDFGKYGLVKPLEFQEFSFGAVLPDDPTLRLEESQAIDLMDSLWAIGIRPTRAAIEPETTTAMKEHLADLRKLIFERRVK